MLPPFETVNLVTPEAEAEIRSPEFVLLTTSAALLAIPPETERTAGVFEDEPIYMPESKSEESTRSPDPLGVRVKSSFEAVVISVVAPEKVKPVEPTVLLVRVSEPAKVERVPEVGSVKVESPEVEKVRLFVPMFKVFESAPAKVKELLTVKVFPSVPASVSVFEEVSVFPSAIVKVAEVPGSVIVRSFMEVAEATPKTGVTKVGEVENTTFVVVVPVVPVAEER